jgi:hypothetical protein
MGIVKTNVPIHSGFNVFLVSSAMLLTYSQSANHEKLKTCLDTIDLWQ